MSKFFQKNIINLQLVVLKVYHLIQISTFKMVSKTTHNIQKSGTYFPIF